MRTRSTTGSTIASARHPVGASGVFTVSLDFELAWGVHDLESFERYRPSLVRAPDAALAIFELFEKASIGCTWATVGSLFCRSRRHWKEASPSIMPRYADRRSSPYETGLVDREDERVLFAPDIVRRIAKSDVQEIGSHTFSHYYCLERGQGLEEFEADLVAARNVAEACDVRLCSLVFPRNQYGDEHLAVLRAHGFSSFRGREPGLFYRARDRATHKRRLARAFRYLDSLTGMSGRRSHDLRSLGGSMPIDLPGSCFLRPLPKHPRLSHRLQRSRIRRELAFAARSGRFFHLWFHPHNFGANLDSNMRALEELVDEFRELEERHGMLSLTMSAAAEHVQRLNAAKATEVGS